MSHPVCACGRPKGHPGKCVGGGEPARCGCGRALPHNGMCSARWKARGGKPRTPKMAALEVEEIVSSPITQTPEMVDKKDRRPRKEINIRLLEISGRFLHPDGEAAAFQQMSPSWFSTMMKRKDPQSKLTYREIFDNSRSFGRASLLRVAMQHCEEKGSAGVAMTKFMLENEFGFSERRLEEHRGSMKHTHTHEVIPADKDLAEMSDKDLADLAVRATGAKVVPMRRTG